MGRPDGESKPWWLGVKPPRFIALLAYALALFLLFSILLPVLMRGV